MIEENLFDVEVDEEKTEYEERCGIDFYAVADEEAEEEKNRAGVGVIPVSCFCYSVQYNLK